MITLKLSNMQMKVKIKLYRGKHKQENKNPSSRCKINCSVKKNRSYCDFTACHVSPHINAPWQRTSRAFVSGYKSMAVWRFLQSSSAGPFSTIGITSCSSNLELQKNVRSEQWWNPRWNSCKNCFCVHCLAASKKKTTLSCWKFNTFV